jgi:hypothetical protein
VLSCAGNGLATTFFPYKEFYQLFKIHSFRINSEWEQAKGPNTSMEEEEEEEEELSSAC